MLNKILFFYILFNYKITIIDSLYCHDQKTGFIHYEGSIFHPEDKPICYLCICKENEKIKCNTFTCKNLNCHFAINSEKECCNLLNCNSNILIT